MGKYFQTAAAMACLKTLTVMFNFSFLISGLVMLFAGVWMKMKLFNYMEMSTEFSGTAPYVVIGTGAFIIVTSLLACCCTFKGQPVLLFIYGAFLAIVFVLELGAGISIFAYRTKLQEGFDKGLTQAMMGYMNDAHMASDIDQMQRSLACCGNHEFTDWQNLVPKQRVPLSCCIRENCDTENENEIYTQGCYNKIIEFINQNIGLVAGIALSIAILPLCGIFLSCCLASILHKAKYEQMA